MGIRGHLYNPKDRQASRTAPEARENTGTDGPAVFRGGVACQHFSLGLLAFRMVTEYSSHSFLPSGLC